MSSRNPPLVKQAKNWSGAYGTAENLGTLPPCHCIVCGNSLGVQSNGNVDFKLHHGITCTSCYFPESVSYRAMGRSILSLHYLFLIKGSRYVRLQRSIYNESPHKGVSIVKQNLPSFWEHCISHDLANLEVGYQLAANKMISRNDKMLINRDTNIELVQK